MYHVIDACYYSSLTHLLTQKHIYRLKTDSFKVVEKKRNLQAPGTFDRMRYLVL